MARVSNDHGITVTTQAGLQVRQYRDQLANTGLLSAITREKNLVRKRRLAHAAANLVAHLRRGRIDSDTKAFASELGLHVTPNGTDRAMKATEEIR